MRAHLLLLLVPALGSAQSFSVGAKVGMSSTTPQSESRPYSVGPSVEIGFGRIAVEAGAFYRRIGQTYTYNYNPTTDSSAVLVNRIRGNSWEFPLIGKYYFGSRSSTVRPFAGTGWAFRTVGLEYKGATTTILSGQSLQQVTPFQVTTRGETGVGATFAGGVVIRMGRMQWQPEVRFTKWGQPDGAFQGPRNEGSVFLGFRF